MFHDQAIYRFLQVDFIFGVSTLFGNIKLGKYGFQLCAVYIRFSLFLALAFLREFFSWCSGLNPPPPPAPLRKSQHFQIPCPALAWHPDRSNRASSLNAAIYQQNEDNNKCSQRTILDEMWNVLIPESATVIVNIWSVSHDVSAAILIVLKQRNSGLVGAQNQPSWSRTLFLGKQSILFQ